MGSHWSRKQPLRVSELTSSLSPNDMLSTRADYVLSIRQRHEVHQDTYRQICKQPPGEAWGTMLPLPLEIMRYILTFLPIQQLRYWTLPLPLSLLLEYRLVIQFLKEGFCHQQVVLFHHRRWWSLEASVRQSRHLVELFSNGRFCQHIGLLEGTFD